MKISTTVTKVITEDIELETPAFFKNDYGKFMAFYSIDHTLSVTSLDGNYRAIIRSEFSSLYKPQEMISKGRRITEVEFNEALAEAIMVISGVEIQKEAPLSIAS